MRCADQTSATVVDEVDENFRVLIGLESGTVRIVTEEHVEKVLLVDLISSVVDLAFVVDVGRINFGLRNGRVHGLIEELAWVWVPRIVSNIVVGEVDNVLTRNSIIEHDLNGMMRIGLMSVVAVGVGASHDDSPVV